MRRDGLAGAWESAFPLVGLMGIVTLIALAVGVVDDALLTRTATTGLINMILVVGLYIFVGTSGIMSFGHFCFVAIGAYTCALLTIPTDLKGVLLPELPGFLADAQMATVPAVAIAGLVAGAVALVVSIPLMRVAGLLASMATLAVLQMSTVVFNNWESVTLGTGGLSGVPTDVTMWRALPAVLVVLVVAFLYQRSSHGLRLRASREDEPAALAAGVSVPRERRIAFVLSAVIVAIGGALFGHYFGTFGPNDFYISSTFMVFAMLVLGGTASLAGAVLGTILLSGVNEGVIQVEQAASVNGLREIVLALVIIAVMITRPRGLTRGSELRWKDVRDRVARRPGHRAAGAPLAGAAVPEGEK